MPEELALPPTPSPDGKPHVYVINSSQDFLDMIHDVLSDAQLFVTLEQQRPNVEVTLQNLRAAQPDLLLLDVVPARSDAARLLAALADSEDLHEFPVLLASTSPQLAEALAKQYAALVREVLPKPFELDDLYARLHRLVRVTMP
jgi:CheY-like chemotaxis protein